MPRKLQKIKLKYHAKTHRVKIRFLILALVTLSVSLIPRLETKAENCPDLRIIFARGSGGERWTDTNYLEFKSTIENKLNTTGLNYDFIDLGYPAVSVGAENLEVSLGALTGAGEAYEFGDSINIGVKNLKKIVNGANCPDTKYVIGGYSQGAIVISKSLKNLNANRIIYAATFGDPKLYLPEGKGTIPPACRGENLSDYRMYVPDCQAYKGLLGGYIPYEPETLIGKVGTWCNKRDIFCSSHLSVSDHIGYVSDNLYEDASKVIFNKVATYFNIENKISSPHDTAILIDSSGSMSSMISEYKAEALRLAKETLDSGGRVALFDYRDLDDPYTPVEHCNFETCTLEIFENELDSIQTDGGGDTPESLLSASFHTMQSLNWKYGSTKSLVVLTDANFLAPDRDGMTLDEVVRLSKTIDPVNFYIITDSSYGDYYNDLADKTDGMVITNFDELSLLTDYIIERYDSLPRVKEGDPEDLPHLEIENVEQKEDSVTIKFTTNGSSTLVALNDKVLGTTDDTEITITGLKNNTENKITLVPLGDDVRGSSVEVDIVSGLGSLNIPKAPNTGKR